MVGKQFERRDDVVVLMIFFFFLFSDFYFTLSFFLVWIYAANTLEIDGIVG